MPRPFSHVLSPLCFVILTNAALMSDAIRAQSVVIQTIPADPITDWSDPLFWETTDGEPIQSSWEFSDSEIRLVKPRGGKGSLLSPPLPSNFELSWQWKIENKTNTGLKYRVRNFGNRLLGLEYQIIDEPLQSKPSKGSTASIYDLVAPSADKPLKPAGQWNHSRVVAIGDRIEHHLNGQLVASVVTRGPSWDVKIAMSKFWGADRFGQPADQDRIMLTDHGGKASYKDFKFAAREAPKEDSAAADQESPPYLGNGIRIRQADHSLTVLWTRTTAQPGTTTVGAELLEIPETDVGQLSKETDAGNLLADQLPEGAELKAINAACPGAAGEVRLSYFPALQNRSVVSTEWQATSADHDFTVQWKLAGLKPGKEYAAVVEARPVGGDEPTAVVRGAFKVAPRPNR